MLEITTTRHNPGVDPLLHVWGWEIPLYLFVGGVVAGMMVIAGIAMLRTAKGEDTRKFFSMQTPLLAFMLLNLGMRALLLDLAHRLYVWAVYLTFQVASPMSWGSWVLLIVYGILLVSALIRLHEAWPWLGRTFPVVQRWSDAITSSPGRMSLLGWLNILFGVGVGIYTGILLNTMVARPLWNTVGAAGAVPGVRSLRGRRGDAHRDALLRPPPGAAGHDRRLPVRVRPAARAAAAASSPRSTR